MARGIARRWPFVSMLTARLVFFVRIVVLLRVAAAVYFLDICLYTRRQWSVGKALQYLV